MFDAAVAGELKALIVFGEDIAQTDPDSGHVRAAIEACELVVSQEIFLSETAKLADVVFPAASFLEKDGTFTNFDRRVQRVRPALEPPGEARPDFEIIRAVAAALGADLGCPTPAAAFDEMASLTPDLRGHLARAARARGRDRLALPLARRTGRAPPLRRSASRRRAARRRSPRSPTRLRRGARRRIPAPARHRPPPRALQLGNDDPADRQPRAGARGAARAASRGCRRPRASPTASAFTSPAGAGQIEATARGHRAGLSRPGVHRLPLPRDARQPAHVAGSGRGHLVPGVQGDRGPGRKRRVSFEEATRERRGGRRPPAAARPGAGRPRRADAAADRRQGRRRRRRQGRHVDAADVRARGPRGRVHRPRSDVRDHRRSPAPPTPSRSGSRACSPGSSSASG